MYTGAPAQTKRDRVATQKKYKDSISWKKLVSGKENIGQLRNDHNNEDERILVVDLSHSELYTIFAE